MKLTPEQKVRIKEIIRAFNSGLYMENWSDIHFLLSIIDGLTKEPTPPPDVSTMSVYAIKRELEGMGEGYKFETCEFFDTGWYAALYVIGSTEEEAARNLLAAVRERVK